jgi:ParB/RepB/Spo0J family partition protein
VNVELHQLDLRYEKLRTRKPETERKLVGSLAEIGQQVPVVVVHGDAPERFVLVDGYKRVRALRRLGQDLVGATCWDLGEAEALVLDRLMRTGEGATALEQGWLLHELAVRFALSLDDLGRRFARSASWVSRRLALVEELPEAIQEHVRRGELPAHAAMKHLVPLACPSPKFIRPTWRLSGTFGPAARRRSSNHQRRGADGGVAEKGAEEGPGPRTRIIAAPNVRDEGLAPILHQAFERRVFDRLSRRVIIELGLCRDRS